MVTLAPPPLYDEIVELLASHADAERLRNFRLSPERQGRLDALLERNREGTLTADEIAELSAFERFEHVVRLLKIRGHRKQRSDA